MKYFVKRFSQIPVTLLALSIVLFVMVRLSGDPVSLYLPLEASREQVEDVRRQLGLDRPIAVQYARYLLEVARGDFGTSLLFRRSAIELIIERVPHTLSLAVLSLFLAVATGILLGVAAALRQGSALDEVVLFIGVITQSVPGFWLGILLIMIFAVQLHWLPTSGGGAPRHAILPTLTLASYLFPRIMLLMRASMLDVMHEDFVRTARSKGLSDRVVYYKHVLRNALNPVITNIGMQFGSLMGGAIITESLFSWPGMGHFMVQAVFTRDFPVVQAGVLLIALLIILSNLAAETANALLDPRIRYG